MIPLKIRQKLSHIRNNLEQYEFTKEQIDKFNSLLNDVWYAMDYALVVEKAYKNKKKLNYNGKTTAKKKM
jgi:hypothetical protein